LGLSWGVIYRYSLTVNIPISVDLHVHDISYENTWRVGGPDTSISTIVQHIDLTRWIQDTFPLVEYEMDVVDSSDDDDAPV
jgi:hypothetical protein